MASPFKKFVACKNCATSNLSWSKTEKGWRLFDEDGNPHHCDSSKGPAPKSKVAQEVNSDMRKLAEEVATCMLKIAELEVKIDELGKEVETMRKSKAFGQQMELFGIPQ